MSKHTLKILWFLHHMFIHFSILFMKRLIGSQKTIVIKYEQRCFAVKRGFHIYFTTFQWQLRCMNLLPRIKSMLLFFWKWYNNESMVEKISLLFYLTLFTLLFLRPSLNGKLVQNSLWDSTRSVINPFRPMFHFYTPWKCQKTFDFPFSGGLEM